MSFRLRALGVRRFEAGLRWQVEARAEGAEPLVVTADTDDRGGLIDLQSQHFVGSSGDEMLDDQVADYLLNLRAASKVVAQLLEIDGAGRTGRRP